MNKFQKVKTSLSPIESSRCQGGKSMDGGLAYKAAYLLAFGLTVGGSFCVRAYENFYPLVLR